MTLKKDYCGTPKGVVADPKTSCFCWCYLDILAALQLAGLRWKQVLSQHKQRFLFLSTFLILLPDCLPAWCESREGSQECSLSMCITFCRAGGWGISLPAELGEKWAAEICCRWVVADPIVSVWPQTTTEKRELCVQSMLSALSSQPALFRNTNVEDVLNARKLERELLRDEFQKKKEQDKLQREKDKLAKQERKEKEKKRTQKGERKR